MQVLGLEIFFNSGAVKAVQGISYGIEKDELFVLLGHNGAGKSTTINALVGNIRPSGESREHCVVIGGLRMYGKEVDVNVSNLTLRKSKGNGVWGWGGASMHLDNVSVENSGSCGVEVNVAAIQVPQQPPLH